MREMLWEKNDKKEPNSHEKLEKLGFRAIEKKNCGYLEVNQSKANLKSLVDFFHHLIIQMSNFIS